MANVKVKVIRNTVINSSPVSVGDVVEITDVEAKFLCNIKRVVLVEDKPKKEAEKSPEKKSSKDDSAKPAKKAKAETKVKAK